MIKRGFLNIFWSVIVSDGRSMEETDCTGQAAYAKIKIFRCNSIIKKENSV